MTDARIEESGRLSELAIRSKAYWGYDRQFMNACRQELCVRTEAFDSEAIRVARVDGEIVGFYRLSLEGEEAEIEAFFVEPRFLRAGVGRAMWQDLSRRVRASGALRLICQSDPNAETFYVAMGMHRIGSSPSASIPGRRLPLLAMAIGQAGS